MTFQTFKDGAEQPCVIVSPGTGPNACSLIARTCNVALNIDARSGLYELRFKSGERYLARPARDGDS